MTRGSNPFFHRFTGLGWLGRSGLRRRGSKRWSGRMTACLLQDAASSPRRSTWLGKTPIAGIRQGRCQVRLGTTSIAGIRRDGCQVRLGTTSIAGNRQGRCQVWLGKTSIGEIRQGRCQVCWTGSIVQSDMNWSVDLQSTKAVADRGYSRMRGHLCRSVVRRVAQEPGRKAWKLLKTMEKLRVLDGCRHVVENKVVVAILPDLNGCN